MDAARPWISCALAALLLATVVGTVVHRPQRPSCMPHARAVPRALLALQRSQIVALEAHAALLDQRIDLALTELQLDALRSSDAFKLKLGPACSGLSCFD